MTEKTTETKIHRFEAAGLGKAPFRCVGVEHRVGPIKIGEFWVGSPGQPMGSCNFCGQSIADCFVIRSADAREFVVGCDCVMKTGDVGLKRTLDGEKKKLDREKRRARAEAVTTELTALLNDEGFRAKLASEPHPRGFVDRATGEPLTALDQIEWLFHHSGAAGRARLLKSLRARDPYSF